MTNEDKIRVVCPLCGQVSNVSKKLIGNKWGIDDVKCSLCFTERSTFVNLVPTKFEKERLINETKRDPRS